MDYCLVVKESMRQILEGSRCRVYTNRCEMTESGIWRVTEREMFRRNIESEGTEHGRQEATQLNKDSGGDALMGHTRSHPEHDG